MKAVQIVFDEPLLVAADREARRLRLNRSELVRAALAEFIRHQRIRDMDERERKGYERSPVLADEFDVWDKVAVWPED